MATIIQRVLKGSPLTLQEHDDNFLNLNAELATKATPASVDLQITTAVTAEASARISADNAEVTNRNTAITAGDLSTLNTAKTYTDTSISTEVTNRNTAITSSVTTLKGGVAVDGDTLGKLRALITGTNTGTNTGDETLATIKSKLGITTLSGSNTGDQTNITGNAGTASKLATVRTINGVDFDGTASININAIDSTNRVAVSSLGVANGVATLGSDGKVLSTQLPSYVDDVIEGSTLSGFPTTGETGKIYVALDTNKTYRWSGSAYVYITSGAVDSVAGKTGIVSLVKADVGLGNVDNTADSAKPVSTAQQTADSNVQAAAATDATTKANAAQAAAIAASTPVSHIGTGGTSHAAVTTTVAGFMSAADKSKLDGIAIGATSSVGTVTAVTGSGAIVSSGGTTPAISIVAASNSVPGTMSVSDKIKLDAISGTNTGDESTASIQSKLGIITLSGSNTGDETGATIKSKLGIITLSGSNTGDETLATIKTKLGVTTLSGSNTGDQTTITGNAGTATKLDTARNINGVAFDGTTNITINAVDSTARVASSLLGAVNGVATLDATGLVLSTQLPSYVDDVIEGANLAAFPAIGETGKIYVALDTNKTYRWSGTVYIYITSGAVDSVAGKTGVVSLVKADVGLGNVDNTADSAKPVSTAQATANTAVQTAAATDATTKANAAQTAAQAASTPIAHVGSGGAAHAVVTTSVNGFMLATDKSKLDSITGTNTGDQTTITGNAGSATNVNITSDNATATTTYINFTTGVTGNLPVKAGTNLSYVPSTGSLTASGNVTAFSDERLKKDWIDLPTDFVEHLSTVKHGNYTRVDTEQQQVGVSAQQLQSVLPNAVAEDDSEEKMLSVAYGNAALVAAIELAKEVVRLKAVNANHEERIKSLEALLNK